MSFRLILPLVLAAAGAPLLAQQSGATRSAGRLQLDLPAPEATAAPASEAPSPVRVPAVNPDGGSAATSDVASSAVLPPPTIPDVAAVTQGTEAAAASPATGARTAYTLDTPIRDLIADPATRAVLDKDLPGLSGDENLAKFSQLGLRQFQPLTGGQLTDALLAKVARDLAGVGGAVLRSGTRPAGSHRSRDESR